MGLCGLISLATYRYEDIQKFVNNCHGVIIVFPVNGLYRL